MTTLNTVAFNDFSEIENQGLASMQGGKIVGGGFDDGVYRFQIPPFGGLDSYLGLPNLGLPNYAIPVSSGISAV
ncbi:hypothetical protein [Streptococcus sobrinus]|uniref:hypothetical protein n=1 Tax=Streptococcus sobrinus TaxID=1310 RepID=UPI00031BF665|nr:hypothetical protein [Streptococcus sobrinus]